MEDEEIRKANEGITPIVLPHAKDYQRALRELEYAESSSLNINRVVWLHVREAITSIGNALDLFKVGYPDAACYCLRQAIELATCFAYLHELPSNERNDRLSAWRSQTEKFPMRLKMEKELECLDGVYAEIHNHMPLFFEHLEAINKRINKHVHKQGYDFFYHYRHFMPSTKKQPLFVSLIKEYEGFIEATIGAVAVFKLVLDPLPILLSEEEIENRLPDLLTEPYSNLFMERYIGKEFIEEFKSTERYQDFKNDIELRPRLNDAVYDLRKWQIFERKNAPQILDQLDQLDYEDRLVVLLALASNKVAHVYFHYGLLRFTTDTKGKGISCPWSSDDFEQIRFSGHRMNIPFKDVLLTVFDTYDDDVCFVEHDTPFDAEEWLLLCKTVASLNNNVIGQMKDMEQITK